MRKTQGHRAWAFLLLFAATVIASPAQTFTTLVSFDGNNGSEPYFPFLAQGRDGNLYGTTYGAADFPGTVFKITADGALTTLHNFNYTDGAFPQSSLILSTNGSFYGTTCNGGRYQDGTVFEVTAGGTLTTLHSFDGTDGANPFAGLIQGSDGDFYGTSFEGGPTGLGTIFEITPKGTFTTLHRFAGSDGSGPAGGLVQSADGNLYGTTASGGAGSNCGSQGCGTVFKITPGGTLTTLHSFDFSDGSRPFAGLVRGSDGNFYGTTYEGGVNSFDGTVFKITPKGALTTLHTFVGTDGASPYAGLVQATDGSFYGTTYGGGANGDGTTFKITRDGVLTTLHSFDGTDGYGIFPGLVQATNGKLYGAATAGGSASGGTVFSLGVGLGPFVSLLPYSGKIGTTIEFLGQGLKGTTAVSFNGTPATFHVHSNTYLTARVPRGATTGFVTVTKVNGKLKSNKKFVVLP
jgi:uncharacterized repeat protein (TIGR03803 family)